LKIEVEDLLSSVQALRSAGTRIGWPDDPTPVSISDAHQFATVLDSALTIFQVLRGGNPYLVNAEVNSCRREVWIRFVQPGPGTNCNGKVEKALESAFRSLRSVLTKNRGNFHYWGGNNYFDVSLPFRGPMREDFPDVRDLPWDDSYRYLLERASWRSLREKVFRFSNLAESFAARCLEFQTSKILIPSVGLCIHPWQFADQGLAVVATELANSALTALSEPACWPRMYSRTAFERWDLAEAAHSASQGNLDHFERMPNLEDQSVRERLRQRITFVLVDWTALPLRSGSIDAIFATNALPRESVTERISVLKEWIRVVRPGGMVFIAQHNFLDSDIEPILRDAGWVEANILRGEGSTQGDTTRFQVYYSSG
jgi:hypothetical protein